jgi:hypothetical protein
MSTWNGLPLIDDDTWKKTAFHPAVRRGMEPRNYAADPETMFAAPSGMTLTDPSEYDARIEEQDREESSLMHVRLRGGPNGQPIPCLDQDGFGYCWSHSTTHAVMVQRAAANLPYVPLSAFAVAATIKNGRDEGGWCGLSAKFARERGIPSQALWPQGKASPAIGTPAVWADAATRRITEDWVDLTRDVWDQNLTVRQLYTCLFNNQACPVDFNWWGHSVCALRVVRVEAGSYGLVILNSWYVAPGQEWGDRGMAVLRGSKAVPDGAVCVRQTVAAGPRPAEPVTAA